MDLYANIQRSNSGGGEGEKREGREKNPPVSKAQAAAWSTQRMLAQKRRNVSGKAPLSTAPNLKPEPENTPASAAKRAKREENSTAPGTAATSAAEAPSAAPAQAVSQSQSTEALGFDRVVDPYDPSRPNDYMEYCEARIERRRQEERERDYQETLRRQDEERKRLEDERMATIRRIQAEVAAAAVISSQSAVGGGVGAPPVVVAAAGPEGAGGTAPSPMGRGRGRGRGLSNLPAWLTKQSAAAAGSGSDLAGAERPAPSGAAGRFEDAAEAGGSRGSAGGEDGGAFATRLMANMGYREGEGLGRERQGISRPLQAQAVGNGQGVVGLHADDRRRSGPSGAEAGAAAGGAEGVPPEGGTRRKRGLFSNPTCVLLLKNMVGPGEVDENLADETKGECEKYGPVSACAVHEVTAADDALLPPEERVRTFVQFERQESAVKAFRDMNGRFFGGRQIAASFYDEMKFMMGELAPAPAGAK